MLQLIRHDLFDIANRIKGIDKNYLIYYNGAKQQYEVHNSSQVGSTYCLTVPYECLDARTVDLVNATRVQNAVRLFQSIEEDNESLQLATNKAQINKMMNTLYS